MDFRRIQNISNSSFRLRKLWISLEILSLIPLDNQKFRIPPEISSKTSLKNIPQTPLEFNPEILHEISL